MMIKSLFLLSVTVAVTQAFSSVLPSTIKSPTTTSRLFAEVEKSKATLTQVEEVGNGSVLLHIETENPLEYEPGNVLYLEIEGTSNSDEDDTKKSWLKGPYTVSRASENILNVILKVVGNRSKTFAAATPGTPLQYGGTFKVPILEGVDVDTTSKVIMISTGVGVGPCVGAIEKALGASSDNNFPPIHLFACYRNPEDVILSDHLDDLQKRNSDQFAWTPILSSSTSEGRISSSANDNLDQLVQACAGIDDTHFHLIGNGQMVQEFQAGLEKAGVPKNKVTFEMYFNHKAEVDEDAIDRIAKAVKETAAVGSNM
eukprot:scaffold23668_cov127-Cylindrotheca_fusiformis.AAC.2